MIIAQQVRRPLVGVALSAAAGFYIQRCAGGSPLFLLGMSAFLLAAACRAVFHRHAAALIYIACGLLAATHSAVENAPAFLRTVLPVAEVSFHEQELTGTIQDDPAVSAEAGTVSFLFRTTAVNCAGRQVPADAVLRVYLKNGEVPVLSGEQWKLKGRYTGYETARGGAEGYLSVAAADACRIREAGGTFAGKCYQVRRRAAALLRTGVEAFPEQTQLLHAMLLGYRQAISSELYQIFIRTGTLHIFAISGQHAVILAAIFIAGLKITGIARPRWGLLLIPALFLYVFTTGMQPSALRAFAMAAVFFAAPLARRRPDAPSSMALAALLLLILNPAHIANPGFLLSFAVVCGLIMVHSWTARQLAAVRSSGWAEPLNRLRRNSLPAALIRSCGLLLLTSLAAWLFSAPVTAAFFNSLSPVALIGNLAVVPLTFMIMLTGCLALLAGPFFIPAAAWFNQANLLFIDLLMKIVSRLAELPGAYLAVRTPPAAVTGLWFAGLTLFFTGPVRWRKGSALLFLLSVLIWSVPGLIPPDGIRILRGDDSSVLFQLPGRRPVLVTDASPFKIKRTAGLVQKEGIGRLHTLVIRDAQADAAVVRRLQEMFRPEHTLFPGGDEVFWPAGQGRVGLSAAR